MTEEQQPDAPDDDNTSTPSGFDLGIVIAQAKQVITAPASFYHSMPKGGGFSEPIIFGLVMAAIAGAVVAVLSVLGITGAGMAGVAAIIVLPIGTLIGSFIVAAILFVIWKLMGSSENYQTAYRCVAYSYGILPILALFSIIPYLGTVVRVAWGVWLMITASIEVHGRAKQTALIVFGILGFLALATGLSGERAQRNMESAMQENAAQLQEQFKSLENLGIDEDGQVDPEKAGRAMGEFLRGMQEATEGMEEDSSSK